MITIQKQYKYKCLSLNITSKPSPNSIVSVAERLEPWTLDPKYAGSSPALRKDFFSFFLSLSYFLYLSHFPIFFPVFNFVIFCIRPKHVF